MTALAIAHTLLAAQTPPPSLDRLAELLQAGDVRLTKGKVRARTSTWVGSGQQGEVRLRYVNSHVLDGSRFVSVQEVEIATLPNAAVYDSVAGQTDEYGFELARPSPRSPWHLSNLHRAPFRESPDSSRSWDGQLFTIENRRLQELIADAAFETTLRPGPFGRCVVEGRRQTGEGLRSYVATVAVTPRYAYIVASTARGIYTRPPHEWVTEAVSRVREEAVPMLVSNVSVSRTRTDEGETVWKWDREHEVELAVTDADREKFRLTYYGLPEPGDPDESAAPVLPPARTRGTYTGLLLLPLGGVLLLLIGRRLRRRKPQPISSAT